MTTEKELGEALKRGDSTIVVEFDLVNKVLRIKTTEKGMWALCVGAIGVAAVCGVVTISTAGTATVPSAFTGSSEAYAKSVWNTYQEERVGKVYF